MLILFFQATAVFSLLFTPVHAASVQLSVPFTSQAPAYSWQEPWQNACEETSILMIDYFYADKTLSPTIATREILKIFRLKESLFKKSFDEPAHEIVSLINAFFPWEAYTVKNPTLAQLLEELDNGRPIIIPAYGTALNNPYFLSSQLDYHTLVLSGYNMDTQEFIAQEPGTRRGLDFRYPFDTIMTAMHDFVPGNTQNGPKLAIFTRSIPIETARTDGDKDGLTKEQEIEYGTVLWLADSDGDGYKDGEEVASGYIPTFNEHALVPGSLFKSPSSPFVYILSENRTKRHIATEEIFIRRGYSWKNIFVLSEAFIESIPTGTTIQ